MRRGEVEGESCDDDHEHDHLLLISEDVLINILLCLPVISLLRFKSVCKSWLSIIESSFFIHLHATTTFMLGGSSSSSSSLLFRGYQEEKKGKILFTLSGEEFEVFEDLGRPGSMLDYLAQEEFEVWKMLFGVLVEEEESMDFFVVGCCDGIICLHDFLTRNVVIWNPATEQSRTLPKPSNLLGFSKCCSKIYINEDDGYSADDFVRFGIDIKTNDYKLLLITTYKLILNAYGSDPEDEEDKMFLRSDHQSTYERRRVHVYSLSTDSWKCIEDATLSDVHPDLYIDIAKQDNQGVYLNGSYFFTAIYFNEGGIGEHRWTMSLLLSFDFAEEIFRTIEPPFDLRSNCICGDVYFISFGEKVALIYVKKEEEEVHDCVEYDIWVLNEHHGVKESWTKFYTIGLPDNLFNDPLFITSNGEFAITYGWYWLDDREQDVPKLQLLNLMTGEKKVLRCDCESLSTDIVYVYKPSLMPIGPISGNGAAHSSRFLEFDGTP